MEFRVGINNITDKDPPLITVGIQPGGQNSYGTYDLFGRQAFMALTAKF